MTGIQQFAPDLTLIDLDLPRTGFRKFISSWLVRRDGTTLLIDPGPRAVQETLRKALQFLGVTKIDAVLLTHIHMDHAGGAGCLLQDYPQARMLVHPKSIPHLRDPSRLWESSRLVLGSLADEYGSIEPVAEDRMFFEETTTVNNIRIQAVDTPGHAPHHLCLLIGDTLFAGEIAGIHYPLDETFYLRPATPAGFRLDIFRGSVEKAAALPAARICFGHYGCRTDPAMVMQKASEQLNRWVNIIRDPRFRSGHGRFRRHHFTGTDGKRPPSWQGSPCCRLTFKSGSGTSSSTASAA